MPHIRRRKQLVYPIEEGVNFECLVKIASAQRVHEFLLILCVTWHLTKNFEMLHK